MLFYITGGAPQAVPGTACVVANQTACTEVCCSSGTLAPLSLAHRRPRSASCYRAAQGATSSRQARSQCYTPEHCCAPSWTSSHPPRRALHSEVRIIVELSSIRVIVSQNIVYGLSLFQSPRRVHVSAPCRHGHRPSSLPYSKQPTPWRTACYPRACRLPGRRCTPARPVPLPVRPSSLGSVGRALPLATSSPRAEPHGPWLLSFFPTRVQPSHCLAYGLCPEKRKLPAWSHHAWRAAFHDPFVACRADKAKFGNHPASKSHVAALHVTLQPSSQ
jgi:hypothetical protein